MGLKTWKKWTDWPLMVLSVVFLVVYSWEILSRTHIALCETVINVIWVVFVVDYVVSLWLADTQPIIAPTNEIMAKAALATTKMMNVGAAQPKYVSGILRFVR